VHQTRAVDLRCWGACTIANARPTGAGYDLILLGHVVCIVVALGSLLASALFALRALDVTRGAAVPDAVRRYFAPGVNWVGRTLYGVPVFGFVLLALSHGSYGLDDGWVLAGLVAWLAVAFAAEGVVWPAERRIQGHLAASPPGPGPALRRDAVSLAVAAGACVVVLIAATVVMVAKP
jgi:uncharacterized membrane protein